MDRPIAEAPADELLALKRVAEARAQAPDVRDARAKRRAANRRRRRSRDHEPQEGARDGTDAGGSEAVSVELHAEVAIAAPVGVVWRSLSRTSARGGPTASATAEDQPGAVGRRPLHGGVGRRLRALRPRHAHGHNARLTISGPMGMRGARQYVKTYECRPTATRPSCARAPRCSATSTTSCGGYRDGGEELLQAFKAYVETRRTA